MAFDVTLYNFTKPDNSTAIPSGGSTFPCLVMEPCGIINPRISFNQGSSWNPANYNYMYIPTWRRYYWVNDWNFDAGLWYAVGTVDPLASFREEIFSLEEYVVRSESEYDLTIIDQLYPAKAEYHVAGSEFRPFAYDSLDTGTFVLGVANGKDGSVGGITYYVGTQSDLSKLFQFMYNTTDWLGGLDIDDISNDLLKCLVNPEQYLNSLMWFPLAKSDMQSSVSAYVGAGWWNTDILLPYAKSTYKSRVYSISRGAHPQSARGTYLNYAPYTSCKIYVPAFGNYELNLDKFPVGSQMHFQLQIDLITGKGTVFVYPDGSSVGGGQIFEAQVGVPISLTTMTSDILGGITAVGNAVGHAQNIVSGIFGAVGAVADAAKMISPDVSVLGTNGNLSTYANNGCLTSTFKLLVDEDIAHHGRPLFKRKKLGDLSGYTQIRDFDTKLPCTLTEHNQIKSAMERGVYIE